MSRDAMTQHGRLADEVTPGGQLVTNDGRVLPLKEARLRAEARAGLGRTVLEQRFSNPYEDPLAVTYLLPLPADGAVAGFSFRIGERRIVGEVDRREAARERFEQALIEGRSAALVQQERSSLFTQEIGNIPPHTEVVAEILVDQRLLWLAEGMWEWRFPTTVAPRYLGAPGTVPDAERISVDVAERGVPARLFFDLLIADRLVEGRQPESPAHALRARADGAALRVTLTVEGGVALDRDVVVRWPVARPAVGLDLITARPAEGTPLAARGYGLLTLVPPLGGAQGARWPRDLIVLLDTSGSMAGEPLAQARRIVAALIDTLGDNDRLELIAFASAPERWQPGPVAASAKMRQAALAWLAKRQASGGTEMRSGILEALAPLRADAQRQIVLVTDGQIGNEGEIVATIHRTLPPGSRVHTVGVGEAVNRSLTRPVARSGRGVELVLGLGEDPERAARRLVACTAAPLVVGLDMEGSALLHHAPRRMPDLYAAAPALVALCLKPEGGELRVRGQVPGGVWEERLTVPPIAARTGPPAVMTLLGRERVEDLELELHLDETRAEERKRIEAKIQEIGLQFQIATRFTSWVAVSEETTVDPQAPLRRERMPHALPQGMSAAGLGLRSAAAAPALQQDGWSRRPPVSGPLDESDPLLEVLQGAVAPEPQQDHELEGMLLRESLDESFGESSAGDEDVDWESMLGEGEVLGWTDDSEDDSDRGRPAVPAQRGSWIATGASQERRLRGRVVLRKGQTLVIEVTVSEAFDWRPEGEVMALTSAGQTWSGVSVVVEQSTRAGRIAPGQSFRLTLTVPESEALQATAIHLARDEELCIIELT